MLREAGFIYLQRAGGQESPTSKDFALAVAPVPFVEGLGGCLPHPLLEDFLLKLPTWGMLSCHRTVLVGKDL